MSTIILPKWDTIDLYRYLKSQDIEVPIMDWKEHQYLRISIQAYNTDKDIDMLIKYIKKYFKIWIEPY